MVVPVPGAGVLRISSHISHRSVGTGSRRTQLSRISSIVTSMNLATSLSRYRSTMALMRDGIS